MIDDDDRDELDELAAHLVDDGTLAATRTCPACYGSGDGAVVWGGIDNVGVPYVVRDVCPTCGGSGRKIERRGGDGG